MPAHLPVLLADWPAPTGVRALTSLRRGAGVGTSPPPFDDFNLGDRCGDDPQAVAANRAALQRLLNLPAAPVWLRQVHGCEVHLLSGIRPGRSASRRDALGDTTKSIAPGGAPTGNASAELPALPTEPPVADAAVTRVPGEVLAILSADCLPVLLCAADGSEVAAAHAGWRGLASGVIEATVASMHAAPAELLAWLGPAAGPQAYEVGEEVRAAMLLADPGAAFAFAITRPGHWHCDLYTLARRRLRALGVASIHGGDRCTISEPANFYSHRRDGHSGRMTSLIWIEHRGPALR